MHRHITGLTYTSCEVVQLTLQTYTVTFPQTDDNFPTTVEYHRIICDVCGKVIVDDGEGITGDYIEVGTNHYHPSCYGGG